jgi:hypothetical protein
MPILRQATTRPGLQASHHTANLAFRLLGARHDWALLTLNSYIKVRLDLQAYKSPFVVKGPFFPRVVNPSYRIRGTNV